MAQRVVIPVLIAFAITAVLGPMVIPILRKLKVGQTEREELKSHLKKAGTPTMGGLMILAGIVVTSVVYMKDFPEIMPILFVTIGFGIIGFLDDYLKVVLRRSDGLLPWQKMLGQILVTGIFVLYMTRYTDISTKMLIPWIIFEFRDFSNTSHVFGNHWDSQRSQLYRWVRWSCFQCYCVDCSLFLSGCSLARQWDFTDYLCSGRRSAGIFVV